MSPELRWAEDGATGPPRQGANAVGFCAGMHQGTSFRLALRGRRADGSIGKATLEGSHMSVQKIGFVGIRAQNLTAFRRVFEEGLGLTPVYSGDDQVRYELADGTRFEGYGKTNDFHSFFVTGPVVGFQVDDFDAAWSRILALDICALTEIQEEKGQKWVHFQLSDGTVVELIGGVG
jgi:catechol 2,3-dioxygenase-like lactoylglutathione lyase family enzyme